MTDEIKTDITQRSYDKQNVLWAKLSAVRLGLVDKDQVKLGNQRDLFQFGKVIQKLGNTMLLDTYRYLQKLCTKMLLQFMNNKKL